MIIQRAWASIIGLAAAAVGLLRLFSPVTIPLTDALIHILTGILFIAGAWIQKGKYVKPTNLSLGVVYILFGILGGFNWPHIIAGAISIIVSLAIRTAQTI